MITNHRMIEALDHFVEETGDEEALGYFCRNSAGAQIEEFHRRETGELTLKNLRLERRVAWQDELSLAKPIRRTSPQSADANALLSLDDRDAG